MEFGKQKFVKPLVIGLPNRHNVLYDLADARLAAWWIGDTARERTRGKSWYWEPGGTQLWQPAGGPAELRLARGAAWISPDAGSQQFPTEFDWLEHTDEGLRFGHRLRFPSENQSRDSEPVVVSIVQQFSPVGDPGGATPATGFARRLELATSIAKARLQLIAAPGEVWTISSDGRQASGPQGAREQLTIEIGDDSPWRFVRPAAGGPGPAAIELATAAADKPAVCELIYRTRLPVDQFPPREVKLAVPLVESLKVVPGWAATRLPVDNAIMPTGLAWHDDGTLVVSSLKGRVYLARDTDGDGLEDALAPLSDDLAAPYGVHATPDGAVDVITKYALLRLYDRDGDGRAERTEVLASGWGHTDDYHDWAVGLPRDPRGNYYVALPCQQDDRSPAAAQLRGRGLRLVPPASNAQGARYGIEIICEGLRFPMGLALNRGGELFATDNQGNYNPFNELNHLRPGAHFGFINKLERQGNQRPELAEPAIDIPHPWTRSVNGICFLETPEKMRVSQPGIFGPFEGHLLGCEYDTRRLVRMSLELVDGQYQGAAYPFSSEPAEGEPGLLGPVVCAVAPDGSVYVGGMRDSGWGAGANIGSLVKLTPGKTVPSGLAEMRATPDGFLLEFTQPVDRAAAETPAKYSLSLYRRESTPAYGGPDQDRRQAKVTAAELLPDGRTVRLTVDPLQAGFVYELRIDDAVAGDETLWPAEAYYTLRKIPSR